jgi:protease I
MAKSLAGKRIAILATDGFEQAELMVPQHELLRHGAKVEVIAPKAAEIQGYVHHDKGETVKVDQALEQAEPTDYDALVLPGGVMNPDALRMNPQAVTFVRHFVNADKPIAAICHGPWTLINAGGIDGHRLTSWPSLQVDIENAGGIWVDEEVVLDGRLVTSRKPDDLSAFCSKIIEEFARA